MLIEQKSFFFSFRRRKKRILIMRSQLHLFTNSKVIGRIAILLMNNVNLGSFHDNTAKEPIDYNNFLPRGSTVKNTEEVFGLVVFTG